MLGPVFQWNMGLGLLLSNVIGHNIKSYLFTGQLVSITYILITFLSYFMGNTLPIAIIRSKELIPFVISI